MAGRELRVGATQRPSPLNLARERSGGNRGLQPCPLESRIGHPDIREAGQAAARTQLTDRPRYRTFSDKTRSPMEGAIREDELDAAGD
ncbi:hypothetical protein [Paenibacillus sabinae]|uniref:Uncharacterized protein n=1 Tax=Paenibacillus sabinae T27 TaxID=1268072 RepID=X4ZGU2_9BACL|nr:hypothetical protein [Paenibacillus sabinae]AHV95940.1 hypothetical protein PSAB_05020 [Paenibacillus sabinae T27]